MLLYWYHSHKNIRIIYNIDHYTYCSFKLKWYELGEIIHFLSEMLLRAPSVLFPQQGNCTSLFLSYFLFGISIKKENFDLMKLKTPCFECRICMIRISFLFNLKPWNDQPNLMTSIDRLLRKVNLISQKNHRVYFGWYILIYKH